MRNTKVDHTLYEAAVKLDEVRKLHNGVFGVYTYMGHDGDNAVWFTDTDGLVICRCSSGRSLLHAVDDCVGTWRREHVRHDDPLTDAFNKYVHPRRVLRLRDGNKPVQTISWAHVVDGVSVVRVVPKDARVQPDSSGFLVPLKDLRAPVVWSRERSVDLESEGGHAAWERLFGEKLDLEAAVRKYDGGDHVDHLMPNGNTYGFSCEGEDVHLGDDLPRLPGVGDAGQVGDDPLDGAEVEEVRQQPDKTHTLLVRTWKDGLLQEVKEDDFHLTLPECPRCGMLNVRADHVYDGGCPRCRHTR